MEYPSFPPDEKYLDNSEVKLFRHRTRPCSPLTPSWPPRRSWSNLCVSRWRLSPGERHAEIWRADWNSETRTLVSPPAPPPSWRQVYGRLHMDCMVPRGAFSPVHLVIGKSVQQVRVWHQTFLCRGGGGGRRGGGQRTRVCKRIFPERGICRAHTWFRGDPR